jgi:hypothetical protein
MGMKTLHQKIKRKDGSRRNSSQAIEVNNPIHEYKELNEQDGVALQRKFLRKLTNFSLSGSSSSGSSDEHSAEKSENSLDETIEGDSDFSPGYIKMDEDEIKKIERKKRRKFIKKRVRPINPGNVFENSEYRSNGAF